MEEGREGGREKERNKDTCAEIKKERGSIGIREKIRPFKKGRV